jgi:hypothetical protein
MFASVDERGDPAAAGTRSVSFGSQLGLSLGGDVHLLLSFHLSSSVTTYGSTVVLEYVSFCRVRGRGRFGIARCRIRQSWEMRERRKAHFLRSHFSLLRPVAVPFSFYLSRSVHTYLSLFVTFCLFFPIVVSAKSSGAFAAAADKVVLRPLRPLRLLHVLRSCCGRCLLSTWGGITACQS